MNLSDVVSVTASRIREVAKRLSRMVTSLGTLVADKGAILIALTAAISMTATRVRQIKFIRELDVAATASRVRTVLREWALVAGHAVMLTGSKIVKQILTAIVGAIPNLVSFATAVLKPPLDSIWTAARRVSIWKVRNPK